MSSTILFSSTRSDEHIAEYKRKTYGCCSLQITDENLK